MNNPETSWKRIATVFIYLLVGIGMTTRAIDHRGISAIILLPAGITITMISIGKCAKTFKAIGDQQRNG